MQAIDFLELGKKYQCKILAVSKLQPIEKITKLNDLGFQCFGENYIQEALEKIEALKNLHLEWHLIGPIQKNKVRKTLGKFQLIHSIDSVEVAQKMNQLLDEADFQRLPPQNVLLQMNLANENTKHGFSQKNFATHWETLTQLKHLNVIGLMTMPPLENTPERNRPYFQSLRKLRDEFGLKELSMGTSHDYQIALDEGATIIRLGTILFGERPQKG